MSLLHDMEALGLALVQGALVALPRGGALAPLGRLRSPAWAAILPGSILVGTFGPLAAPSTAIWLPVAAALAAPSLAVVAALAVVRGHRAWPVALTLAATVLAVFARGWTGELSATVVTSLACLAVGAAVARLIPAPWMLAGVVFMAVVDGGLLVCGAGQPAAAVIVGGSAHGEVFDSVRIGQLMVDYPDLVLAAALGAFLADQRGQCRGAVLVAALAAVCFVLTPRGGIWPATIPIALTLVSLRVTRLPRMITGSKRRMKSPARQTLTRVHG